MLHIDEGTVLPAARALQGDAAAEGLVAHVQAFWWNVWTSSKGVGLP